MPEIGGTIGKRMVLSYQSYVDPSDLPFGESILLTNSAFPSSGPFAWGSAADELLHGHFSVTELVTIAVSSSTAATGTGFDASLSATAVPEPGTAMILGLPLGLIGIVVARRKLNTTAKPAMQEFTPIVPRAPHPPVDRPGAQRARRRRNPTRWPVRPPHLQQHRHYRRHAGCGASRPRSPLSMLSQSTAVLICFRLTRKERWHHDT